MVEVLLDEIEEKEENQVLVFEYTNAKAAFIKHLQARDNSGLVNIASDK